MPLKAEIRERLQKTQTIDLWGLAVPVFRDGVPVELMAQLARLQLEGSGDPAGNIEGLMAMLAAILRYSPVPEDRLSYEELMALPLTPSELQEAAKVVARVLGTQPGSAEGGEGNFSTPATPS
ncbi:hypothetical protein [Thermus albus]|uniref:hypothetical protein n=1 Tax=Thermus albus TaxID=2908146 RepID=UPI001FA95A3F|nr:hypothetical protein [Thermus albus]